METATAIEEPSRLTKDTLIGDYVHRPDHRGLVFTTTGRARLSSIYGYLQGLHDAGASKMAESLLSELNSQFDYLAKYGGNIEEPGYEHCPRFKVALCDDGTKHGFGIAWYRAVKESTIALSFKERENLSEGDSGYYFPHIREETLREVLLGDIIGRGLYGVESNGMSIYDCTARGFGENAERILYKYTMNGAMIYRGPHAGSDSTRQSYAAFAAVSTGINMGWSIHT